MEVLIRGVIIDTANNKKYINEIEVPLIYPDVQKKETYVLPTRSQ